MATATVFNCLTEDLAEGVHNFDTHTFKVALCNTAPVATNSVLADLTQISAGNGYTAGGSTVPNTATSRTSAETSFVGDAVEFTADGGAIGPFRYWAVYNDTATGDPLVAFWDNGSAITLPDEATFRVRFSSQNEGGVIILLDVV